MTRRSSSRLRVQPLRLRDFLAPAPPLRPNHPLCWIAGIGTLVLLGMIGWGLHGC